MLFLISSINTQGQYIKFANTIRSQSSQYGIRDTTVFKIDSAGNSIWVKDFSGFIANSIYRNQLIGSAFDGEYLYVLENQGRDFSGLPHTYNPAVIKMDTLGNVVFIMQGTVQPGGSYDVIDIFPSLTNGVWILDDYSPGFTHICDAFNMDSLGQTGTLLGFWYGSVASVQKIEILPDSNYVICVNHRPSSPGNGPAYSALTKFAEDGTIIWRADYKITGGLYDALVDRVMTTDSVGNIYLMCDYISSAEAVAGIKIDPNGNVLVSKLFPDFGWYSVQSLTFENGQLTSIINGSQVQFDTLFNNSCLNVQNLGLTVGNNYYPSSYSQTYVPASFSPTNGIPFIFTQPIYPDYCSSVSTDEIIMDKSFFNIYPNPTKNNFNIETDFDGVFIIKIYDPFGRICIEKNIRDKKSIDVSSLKTGIYFVTFANEFKTELRKLIIE